MREEPVLAAVHAAIAAMDRGEPGGPGTDIARSTDRSALLTDLPPRCLVLPTSGSTALPRLVVRDVATWTTSFAAFTAASGLDGGRREHVWAPGPATSTMTLFAAWHAWDAGWSGRADGPWRGLPDDVDDVTVVHAVPAVADVILAAKAAGRMPLLRTLVVAGSVVPARLRRAAHAVDVRLVEYYGAAELSFVAIDPDGAGLRPFPGVEVRVRGGLIEATSPYVARGYLGDADGPLVRRPDGWAGVGDRGSLVDGVLTVTGRGDAGAVVGGVSVYLADVEAVLREVPGVADVACLPEPHPAHGQVVAAVVEPAPDDSSAESRARLLRRVRSAAAARLVPAARPRRVRIDALPRTRAGKVDRTRLTAPRHPEVAT